MNLNPKNGIHSSFWCARSLACSLVLALAGFLLTSTIFVDYVYCCSADCPEFEKSTSPLWSYYFNLVNPYFQHLATVFTTANSLSQLSAQGSIWLLILLSTFLTMRLSIDRIGLRNSFLEIGQLLTWIIFFFEIGIYFICPSWKYVHVTNFQNGTLFSFFNNVDLLAASVVTILLFQLRAVQHRWTHFEWRKIYASANAAKV